MSTRDYGVDDYGLLLDNETLKTLASQLLDRFKDKECREDPCEYVFDLEGKIGVIYISQFTGGAVYIGDDGHNEWGDEYDFCDDIIFYIPLRKYPSLFSAAYDSIDDVVEEVREAVGKYLPADFDYRGNIRHITGTYYG